MRALIPLLLLLFPVAAMAAAPRFVSTPEGEVAVDLELNLNQLPTFSWASDPFLKTSGLGRAASAEQEEVQYKLQATTVEGEDSVAVVNDRVVRVGDRVGQRTVLKISSDFVLLGEKGSVIEATLEDPKPAEQERAPASKGNGVNPVGGVDVGSSIDAVLGSKGSGADPVNRGPADSPVPRNLRLSPDNRAVRAGQVLDGLLDGKMPDVNQTQGTISIKEVKK